MHRRVGPFAAMIFQDFPVAVFIKDLANDGKVILWNRNAERYWGLRENEVLGRRIQEFDIKEPTRKFLFEDTELLNRNHQPIEEQIQSADGYSLWVRSWKLHIRDSEGNAGLLVGISQDITQIKEAYLEKSLKMRQLERISGNIPGVLFQCKVTADGRLFFTYISQKIREAIGVSPEEILADSSKIFESIYWEDRPSFKEGLQEAIKNKCVWNWKGRIVRPFGRISYIHGTSSSFAGNDGNRYWDGILHDITQLQESERQLREQAEKMHQAARLVALGEMAGGVAHEINTPLCTIGILAELATRELNQEKGNKGKVIQSLNEIDRMVSHIGKIIKSMRSYAAKDTNESFERISFYSIIEEVVAVCSHRLKHDGIKINYSRIPVDLYIECQPLHISQVLLNLINNSCDAIKNQTEKWIQIQLGDFDPDWIEISVTDSGPGIPGEISKRLFETFFTTKGPKEGTGLGLSMSRNMMKNHAGDLFLDSRSSHTCFVMRFPRKRLIAA